MVIDYSKFDNLVITDSEEEEEEEEEERQTGQQNRASSSSSQRPLISNDGYFTPAPHDRWARNFPKKDKFEWLSNCYSMRCDDDVVWGGCNLHGAYDPDMTPETLREDFAIFCVLAKRRKVLPKDWDWKAFLDVASYFTQCAFEKSDAQERWGGENIFMGQMEGQRSLRATGVDIIGTGIEYGSPVHPDFTKAERDVKGDIDKVFEEIGGKEVWDAYLSKVRSSPVTRIVTGVADENNDEDDDEGDDDDERV